MLTKIKAFLKKFLPPPVNVFNREINRVIKHDEKQTAMLADIIKHSQQEYMLKAAVLSQQGKALAQQVELVQKKSEQQAKALTQQVELVQKKGEQQAKALTQQVELVQKKNERQVSELLMLAKELSSENKNLKLKLNEFEKRLTLMQGDVQSCARTASETVWAEIFNNVISDSRWLNNKAFSAGRWAVGYQYLYVMYRVLNEIRPKNILELGLGQSTRMIGQYAMAHEDVMHFVVEHDPEWIDFFTRDFALSSRYVIYRVWTILLPPVKWLYDINFRHRVQVTIF